MKFTLAATTLALAAGVSAASNSTGDVYVTEVVTAYTTYCPAPTSVVHNGKTYTVSEATTLTITDCPCTVTYPATSAPAASTTASWVSAPVYSNGTVPTGSGAAKPSGTGAVTGSAKPSAFTGAASANTVSGAAVAALGFAAFFL